MSEEMLETMGNGSGEMLPDVGVQYLGDGAAYVEGVPARDLTREEWDGVREDLRELALATGLYNDPLTNSEPLRSEIETNKARKGRVNPK